MEKKAGITSFTLKIVAIVAMTFDHIPFIFEGIIPEWAACACSLVGGITFPVMAFLITEGYRHTSDVRKYAVRLLLFALISTPPYWIFICPRLNVLFTLFLGLLLVYLDDKFGDSWVFPVGTVGILAASAFCDWGVVGPFAVLLFSRMRDEKHGIAIACAAIMVMTVAFTLGTSPFDGTAEYVCMVLGYPLGAVVNSVMLSRYNGRRGRPLKYFFYIYYPGHIIALALLCFAVTGQLPMAG